MSSNQWKWCRLRGGKIISGLSKLKCFSFFEESFFILWYMFMDRKKTFPGCRILYRVQPMFILVLIKATLLEAPLHHFQKLFNWFESDTKPMQVYNFATFFYVFPVSDYRIENDVISIFWFKWFCIQMNSSIPSEFNRKFKKFQKFSLRFR